ncbi:FAD-dependent oxidoreductase, partial [candidate division KSB1 bacterium]
SIDMTKFNRILAFDSENGIIKVEAGLPIGDLIRFIVQRGWYFKVVPGYPSITIGGCVAFNVHGKSQFNIGIFGDHIKELTLYHPDHGEIICNSTLNKDVFELTIGGFGLTGVILDVTLVLSPLKGNAIIRNRIKCKDLTDAVEKMNSLKNENDNVYSWNNLNDSGKHFGKGIIYLENFSTGISIPNYDFKFKHNLAGNRKKSVVNFINKSTAEFICFYYYNKELFSCAPSVLSIVEGTFPIYGKEIYYYLFGKKGFREYQLIIHQHVADEFFSNLQKLIKKYRIPVTLGSLKLFQGENRYLNFSNDGVCLAIDVPAMTRSENFFSEIDDLTIRFNGKANLSKDSRLSAKTIGSMYDQYGEFKGEILKYDPQKLFTSSLRQRMEV